MTGARRETDALQPVRAALPHLGLDVEDLLVIAEPMPVELDASSLHASSYVPDFTVLVQRLLQLRRPGGTLSIALCGPSADGALRAWTAAQLAIGFTQHGLGTVLVDGDFSRPGLSGLLEDPHQEGLVDMVRFGRSCRALLCQPLASGPQVLGTGSFPLQGQEPFEAEAWRGIVHRVALHGELALYVGPLQVGKTENPMLGAVDQVVYVTTETGDAEEDLERLRHSTARIAAVVALSPRLTGAPAVSEPEAPMGEAREAPPAVPGPKASASPAAAGSEAAGSLPEDEIAAFVEEALPEMQTETPAASAPEPSRELEVGESAVIPPAPTQEAEEAGGGEEALEPMEARSDAAPGGVFRDRDILRPDEAARPPEEAAELRRKLGLDEEEFSYSAPPRYSRVPLYLFLVLMATICGFVGWTLWKSHTGAGRPLRVSPAPSTRPGTQAPASGDLPPTATAEPEGGAPTTAAATPGISEPNDQAAQQAGAPTDVSSDGGSEEAEGSGSPTPTTGNADDGATSQPQEAGDEPSTGGEATPTPSAQPPPPSGPVYAVHVASYRRMEQANQEIANHRKHGYEGRALRTDLGSKGIWFRVLVGSYPSKEAAEEARVVILKLPEYAFAQVRRVPGP